MPIWIRNILKKIFSPLFPHAIVHNQTEETIYIVVDCTQTDHQSTAHSIMALPPHQNTLDIGIFDPEAIILGKHLRRDQRNQIWAPLYTPLIKTPAGSEVWVHNATGDIVSYTSKGIGTMGSLAVHTHIQPSIKDTNRFSKGRFVCPLPHSPLYPQYQNLAQSLPWEST